MANNSNAAATTSNLFSQLYSDKEGKIVNEQNRSLTERSLQRKFQSAYDDAVGLMDTLRGRINSERMKLANLTLQNIIDLNAQIEAHQHAAEIVAGEYKILFGEEIKK